jgi:hypothetical protein
MSPGRHCDEIIRLIDEVLGDASPARGTDGPELAAGPAGSLRIFPSEKGSRSAENTDAAA